MPPKQEKKVNNPFMELFENVGNHISNSVKQEELMEVVKALMKTIKDLEAKLAQNIATNKTTTDQSLSAIEDALSNAKDEIQEIINGTKQESVKNLAGVITQLREEINEVRSEIPEEFDDEEIQKIMVALANRIDELKIPEAFDATELTEKIKNIEKDVEDLKNRPIAKGGGVTDRAIQFALMRSIQAVTPTGTIDGANTDFEVPSTIHAVLSFELNSRVVSLGEYSIIGGARRTIRFDTAPPAAYSGKSFVINYL